MNTHLIAACAQTILDAVKNESVVDTAYANPANPTKPITEWSNGFSLYADNEGRVRCEPWEDYRLTLPDSNKAKRVEYFYVRQALETSIFPSQIARLKCEQNLSQRLWAIVMSPPMFSYEGIRYEVTEKPLPANVDWNIRPGAHTGRVWKSLGLFEDTYSGNWNPDLYDADWWFRFLKARAEAEASSPGGPGWHRG